MKWSLLLITFTISLHLQATGNNVKYLTEKDTVIIQVTEAGQKIFQHKIESGQTLYSLSKFYGLDVYSIYDFNPWLKNKVLSVRDLVKVPIGDKLIHTNHPGEHMENFAPVYYQVKQKDNLFRIARRYFDIPIELVKIRNSIEDTHLAIGQYLLIGWISTEGANRHKASVDEKIALEQPQDIAHQEEEEVIPEPNAPLKVDEAEGTTEENGNIRTENAELKDEFEIPEIEFVYKEQRGIAVWNKEIGHMTDLYALHRDAPVGSTLEITNPMIDKTIYAKVIDHMPTNMYPHQVCIVVSPAIANLLGAVDSRFFVKVRYLEAQN